MEKDTNRIELKLSQLAFILIVPFLAFVISCNDDDDGPNLKNDGNATILQIAQSIDELSIFVSATASYSDMAASLDNEADTFTVFAPTDNAFNVFLEAMGYGSLDAISEDSLRQIIEYHIIQGAELTGAELTDGLTSQTLLANETLTVSVEGQVIMINTAVVSEADIEASNGVIHIIDAVLVPISHGGAGGSTIMGVVQTVGQLSTLETALSKFSNLESTLNDESGSSTLFAPTNDAFDELLDLLGYGSLEEIPQDMLRDILQYHITTQSAFSARDFTDGQIVTTLLTDESVTVYVNGGSIAANSSQVITANVKATNGVVHIIDAVLLPPYISKEWSTVLDLAREKEELSIFVELVERFPDFRATLEGFSGKYTIFAPTNEGFQTLLYITGQDKLADVPDHVLKRFVQYHTADGFIKHADLTVGSSLPTLLKGDALTVNPDTVTGSGVLIDKSQITESDMEADNGVLHIITRILFGSNEATAVNSIMEPVYFNKNFNTLNAAIQKAGMFDFFTSRPASYTFFAPDDNGFEKADMRSIDNYTAEELTTILQYHIHQDAAYTEENLQEKGTLSTQSGNINITSDADGVILNGNSRIIRADIENNTGITHIINRALIPEN